MLRWYHQRFLATIPSIVIFHTFSGSVSCSTYVFFVLSNVEQGFRLAGMFVPILSNLGAFVLAPNFPCRLTFCFATRGRFVIDLCDFTRFFFAQLSFGICVTCLLGGCSLVGVHGNQAGLRGENMRQMRNRL